MSIFKFICRTCFWTLNHWLFRAAGMAIIWGTHPGYINCMSGQWASLINPNCNLFAILPQFQKVENFSIFNIQRRICGIEAILQNALKLKMRILEQAQIFKARHRTDRYCHCDSLNLPSKSVSLWHGQSYNYFNLNIQPLALKPARTEHLN